MKIIERIEKYVNESSNNISKIAKDILGIDTLKTRNSDSKDFYDLAVWDIKKALEMAMKVKLNESSDDVNPRYMFQTTWNDLLVKVATGKIDAKEYAKFELQNRGFGKKGEWIGFDESKKLWKSKIK